jgi:two-component system, cell cycle response regulator
MKILVADDDPVSCRLMQRMLQRDGYEVTVATDGRTASDALALRDGPRLALVDWMMPELDGPGVCREARRRTDGSYVYILLLTAKQSHEDIVEGLEAGADDYLTKPCHPAELNARLLTGRRILQLEQKLVEARESMRFRANHDALTELLNRAAILGRLQQSLQQPAAESGGLAVMVCDIDHFKRINDVHGHLVGDRVLRQVAASIRGAVSDRDWVGRYGGEEFLVVLNGCDSGNIGARAEAIRKSIAGTECHSELGPLNVTASIGAFAVEPWADLPVEEIVSIADKALYRAKGDGRNCVRIGADNRIIRRPLLSSKLISEQFASVSSGAGEAMLFKAVCPS